MTIVEETLSKLTETVWSWSTTSNIILEPLKSMMIEHLQEVLFYLKAQTEDDKEQGDEGSQEAEENILPDSVECSEV